MTDEKKDAPQLIYSGDYTKGAIGYCSSGHWAGWIFWKHPDGQWVSLAKIPDRPQPAAVYDPNLSVPDHVIEAAKTLRIWAANQGHEKWQVMGIGPVDHTPADLIDAARAVIARWDTPAWKESEPTAEVIDRLRMAVDAVPPPQPDPRAEAMGMMVEALESVWYSEFSNNETCMEGRQIKQALNHPAVKPFIKGRG